jgi:hypothetical protein
MELGYRLSTKPHKAPGSQPLLLLLGGPKGQ